MCETRFICIIEPDFRTPHDTPNPAPTGPISRPSTALHTRTTVEDHLPGPQHEAAPLDATAANAREEYVKLTQEPPRATKKSDA